MGREIRMVDEGWEHPRHPTSGQYIPMYEDSYEKALAEWEEDKRRWEKTFPGEEYPDPPLDSNKYLKTPFKNPICFQIYETVSAGTPVSPVFRTKEELVDYLVANGDYWDQRSGRSGWSRSVAESFAHYAWCPTFVAIV